MALLSHNNRLIECRNVALITTSDPHQVIWLEVQIDIYAQQMSYPHALRGNIDAKSINVQVTAKFLASVNWRNVFANDRHVDDYLSSCMHILSDIITQSVSVTSARINKAKSILPKHIRRLIKRKRRL